MSDDSQNSAKPAPKAKAKIRADELVHKLGLSENRSKAQALIMAGEVEYRLKKNEAWKKVEKSGLALREAEVEVRLTRTGPQDVGRGAQKLRSALELWPESVRHAELGLDIGSSTGGFTQVLLEHGLKRVVALDVGTHQLHERLRNDARVLSLEQRHILKTQESDWAGLGVPLPFDIMVTDLSFISVTKVVDHAAPWLKPGGSWIVLLKPQFELGPAKAPRGIVRDPEFHDEAIAILKKSVSQGKSLVWQAIAPSPILGGDGNKEFLVWLKKNLASFTGRALRPFATALLVLSSFALVSCSSSKKKVEAQAAPEAAPVPPEEQAAPPPAITTENLPPPEAPAAPPMPTLKDVQIGVYVDAVGYDALAALGFMQELEKTSVKPVKVVGTGFGCWVAVSWALENSGNRAEWQSFKWTRWDLLPQKGLLNRIKGAIGAEDRFSSEVEKILTNTRFDKLQLPADCPNLENQGAFALQSSREADIKHALWVELLHPALGVPEGYYEDEKQVSGIFTGFPTDDEWDDLSANLPGGGQPILWLYLRTRSLEERRSGVENVQRLGMRPETNLQNIRRTSRGNYYMVMDLSGAKRSAEALKTPGLRRKFLLDGRKIGRQTLESKKIEKAFSELFAPAPDLNTPAAPGLNAPAASNLNAPGAPNLNAPAAQGAVPPAAPTAVPGDAPADTRAVPLNLKDPPPASSNSPKDLAPPVTSPDASPTHP